MTKQEAVQLKKIINSDGHHYSTFFKSKEGVLRVCVYGYHSKCSSYNEKLEKECISEVLDKIQHTMRPRFEIDRKRFQGYLNYTYIVFH